MAAALGRRTKIDKLTPQQVTAFRIMYSNPEEYPASVIAARYGIRPDSVSRWAIQLGCQLRPATNKAGSSRTARARHRRRRSKPNDLIS